MYKNKDAVPQQVKDAKIKQGNMLFKIKWEPESFNLQPQNS